MGWLAERVGGDLVQVRVLPPAGEDPPSWRPSPAAIADLATVDLVVANGAGFEPWIATATLPEGLLVDTTAGLDLIEREAVTHSHGDDGEHTHGAVDPHTWSDPLLFAKQARAVHTALFRALPGAKEGLDARLSTLEDDLRALDGAWREVLAPASQRPIATNHPAYGYLARRYDLHLHDFDLDPEAVPDDDARAAATAWAAAHTPDPHMMWWEARPSDAVRAALGDGWRHVVVDPLEQPDDSGVYDYLSLARAQVRRLRDVFPSDTP